MTSENIFSELEEAVQAETSQESQDSLDATSFESARTLFLDTLRNKALALHNDANLDLNEADIRFSTSLNLRHIREALVCIIGAGGLGNWQWRILAAMGFKRIAIYDDDVVNIENVGSQAHSIFDIGLPKVEAVANAALQYRGLQILARNKRVATFHDIVEDLGEIPIFAIGCTDSAEFRNGFIRNLCYNSNSEYPELFLDFRMSLGDWVCYLTPFKAMFRDRSSNAVMVYTNWYVSEACFPPEQALQEPCTERAIAYTGANAAAYTGAVLHWYYSGGKAKLADADYFNDFLLSNTTDSEIKRKVSFSARDWESITETRTTQKLRRKIADLKLKNENGLAADFLRLYNFGLQDLIYEHLYDEQLYLLLNECDPKLVGAYLIPVKLNNSDSYALLFDPDTDNWYGLRVKYNSSGGVFNFSDDLCVSQDALEHLNRHCFMIAVKSEIAKDFLSKIIQQPLKTIFYASILRRYFRLTIKNNTVVVEVLDNVSVYCEDGVYKHLSSLDPNTPNITVNNSAYTTQELSYLRVHLAGAMFSQVEDTAELQRIEGWFSKFANRSAQSNTESVNNDANPDEVWELVKISDHKLLVGDIILVDSNIQQRFEVLYIADRRIQVKDLTNDDCFYLSRKIDSVSRLVQNKE